MESVNLSLTNKRKYLKILKIMTVNLEQNKTTKGAYERR